MAKRPVTTSYMRVRGATVEVPEKSVPAPKPKPKRAKKPAIRTSSEAELVLGGDGPGQAPPSPAQLVLPEGIEVAGTVREILKRATKYAVNGQPAPVLMFLSGCEYGAARGDNAFGWLVRWRTGGGKIVPGMFSSQLASAPAGQNEEGQAYSAVMRLAARYATMLSGQRWVDSRHLLLALLTPHPRLMSLAEQNYLTDKQQRGLAEFAGEFLRRVEQEPTQGERESGRIERWRQVCEGILSGETAPEHKAWLDHLGSLELRLGAFSPENVENAEDKLGITEDVNAFARLFAARPPVMAPPLSVGLFGAWGSGKSFFMRRLEEKVQALADGADGDSVFLSRIVQVRFNAWHYADADIWASLTSAFFDQLQYGGVTKARNARYAALVRNVAKRAQLTDAASLATKAAELQAVDKSLARLERKQAALSSAATREAEAVLQAIAGSVDEGTRKSLQRLGLPDPSKAAGEVVQGIETLRGLKGFLGRIANFSRQHVAATFAISGVVCIALGIIAARLAGWNVDAFLATVAGVGSALFGATKLLQSLLGKGAAFVQSVEEEVIALEQKAAEEATGVGKEIEALTQKRAVLKAELEGSAEEKDGRANAAGVLEHFLVSSGERERFDAALGLVSRARLAFETLDTILAEEADREHKPERIVLYIDDLDRCAPDQVYKVLQAVHLLIGFPHFVTVVGVDERWVRTALEQHATFGVGRESAPDAQRSTDYLEKIFQIPFWLRPLTTEKDGTYNALIDNLGTTRGATRASPEESAPGEKRPFEPQDPTATTPQPGTEEAKPDRADAGNPQAPDAIHEQIEFTQDELDCMRLLGPIAAKSPRAVKRFVNTCRLIRVREGESDPAFYFGSGEWVPGFAAIMLALAVEVGRSRAESEAVMERVRTMRGMTLGKAPAGLAGAGWLADFDKLFERVCEEGETSPAFWRRAFAIARRYSFNALPQRDADWLSAR